MDAREKSGLAAAARERLAPVADDPVAEAAETFAVPRQTVLAAVALTFMSAIDDPDRFRRSKDVGPWVGLTPGRDQSGERDIVGGITKCGDATLRTALYQAATVMLNRAGPNWLLWGCRMSNKKFRTSYHMCRPPWVRRIGGYSCQIGTLVAPVTRLCAYPTLIRAVASGETLAPSHNPACCGHSVPEAGPI